MTTPDQPEPIYMRAYTAFDLIMGAVPGDAITPDVEFLTSSDVHWIGSVTHGGKKHAVMAHAFSLDDEARTGTSVIVSFLPPGGGDTSVIELKDKSIEDDVRAIPALKDCPPELSIPIANLVYIPALLHALDSKNRHWDDVLDGTDRTRFIKAADALKQKMLDAGIYTEQELQHETSLLKAKRFLGNRTQKFDGVGTATAVATALEREGFGTLTQDSATLTASEEQLGAIRMWGIAQKTPIQKLLGHLLKHENGHMMDMIEHNPALATKQVEYPPHGMQPLLNVWAILANTEPYNFDAGFILMHHLKTNIDNIRDDKGNGPMHWAAQSGNLAFVNLLRNHGASLDILNHAGETPAMVAEKSGTLEKLQTAIQAMYGEKEALRKAFNVPSITTLKAEGEGTGLQTLGQATAATKAPGQLN